MSLVCCFRVEREKARGDTGRLFRGGEREPPKRLRAALPLVKKAIRLLATDTAIWHNHKTGAPVLRSLTAFDH